jgi:hypothetical protein
MLKPYLVRPRKNHYARSMIVGYIVFAPSSETESAARRRLEVIVQNLFVQNLSGVIVSHE